MSSNSAARPSMNILLVDDSPMDLFMSLRVLKRLIPHLSYESVGDGIEALAYLRRQGQYAEAQRPDLILLDMHMPRKNGRQVLVELKSDQRLKSIPVIMLSVSDLKADVATCLALKAEGYLTQPIETVQFEAILNSIEGPKFSNSVLQAT